MKSCFSFNAATRSVVSPRMACAISFPEMISALMDNVPVEVQPGPLTWALGAKPGQGMGEKITTSSR